MKKFVNSSKSPEHIYKDERFRRAHRKIEENTIKFVRKYFAPPVQSSSSRKINEALLSEEDLKNFLQPLGALQKAENKMLADGYKESHLTKFKMYNHMIETLCIRVKDMQD